MTDQTRAVSSILSRDPGRPLSLANREYSGREGLTVRLALALMLPCLLGFSLLEAATNSVTVETESVAVRFGLSGGVPESWRLIDPAYLGPQELDGIELINASVSGPSGGAPLELVVPGESGEATFFREAIYEVERLDDPEEIRLILRSPESPGGIRLIRTYRFPMRGFKVGLTLEWENLSEGPVEFPESGDDLVLAIGPGLGGASRRDAGLAGSLYAYIEPVAAVGTEVEGVELELDQLRAELAGEGTPLRWVGLHNRYFLMALSPAQGFQREELRGVAWAGAGVASADEIGPMTRAGLVLGPILLAAGESTSRELTLFAGPKIRTELESGGEDLERVLYLNLWNWLRWLSFGLLALMNGIHALIPSWGLSIILLAVVIRLVLSPVAQIGIKAQARFNAANARMKPELKRINGEFAKDAAGKHHATMKLYKEHGVSMFSPFKGCLTLFIQIPIFIALFNVIGQAYELRGVGFLWINDLAAPDRLFPLGITLPVLGDSFNLLPVLMALTQVLTTNLAPPDGSDERQRRNQRWSMWAMALAFFLLFYNFPSGLIIYWTSANLGHLAQQQFWRFSPSDRSETTE